MREVRIKGLGMRNWASSMGLLGLFLSAHSPRFSFMAGDEDGRRRDAAPPGLASSPLLEGKMIGVLWCSSGGRWGSCPTLPRRELRLCQHAHFYLLSCWLTA